MSPIRSEPVNHHPSHCTWPTLWYAREFGFAVSPLLPLRVFLLPEAQRNWVDSPLDSWPTQLSPWAYGSNNSSNIDARSCSHKRNSGKGTAETDLSRSVPEEQVESEETQRKPRGATGNREVSWHRWSESLRAGLSSKSTNAYSVSPILARIGVPALMPRSGNVSQLALHGSKVSVQREDCKTCFVQATICPNGRSFSSTLSKTKTRGWLS